MFEARGGLRAVTAREREKRRADDARTVCARAAEQRHDRHDLACRVGGPAQSAPRAREIAVVERNPRRDLVLIVTARAGERRARLLHLSSADPSPRDLSRIRLLRPYVEELARLAHELLRLGGAAELAQGAHFQRQYLQPHLEQLKPRARGREQRER